MQARASCAQQRTRCERVVKRAKGVADGQHLLPHAHAGRVAQRHRLEHVLGRRHLQKLRAEVWHTVCYIQNFKRKRQQAGTARQQRRTLFSKHSCLEAFTAR